MHRRFVLLTVAFSVVAVGCLHLAVPEGDAPLRYRDPVFSDVTIASDVLYGTAENQQGVDVDLLLDVYSPSGDAVTKRPAIIWIHGGSFCCGSKSSPEIVDQAATFAKKGYVSISINYRLSPSGCSAGGATPECVTAIFQALEDAQTAVAFLRENASAYGVDTRRIAIAGTSAGAITALNVGYSNEDDASTAVRAAVSLSGARIFGPPDAGDAPSLLFHGSADGVVPYEWALDTVAAAQEAELLALLTTWEGEGHVPYAQHRREILDQTTNFLYHTLNLKNAPI